MTDPLERRTASPDFCLVSEAVERLAVEGGVEERGAIYTKREVVDFILDLTGYIEGAPLAEYRLLEPSFGDGCFLLPAIDRLLASAGREGKLRYSCLASAIRANELHRATFKKARALVAQQLRNSGLSCGDADRLCAAWLSQGDFLLTEFEAAFTHIVGNPPYVRQEAIPDVLMAEYRKHYKTIYDRADIYVPFIERSLALLAVGGELGFICADRWMKNKYGKKLRELISRNYSLKIYVDMVGTDAFHSEVSTYPAIAVIKNCKANTTRVYSRPSTDAKFLKSLAVELTSSNQIANGKSREIKNVTAGDEPWVLDSLDKLSLVRRLEAQFPTIEDAGCKVGVGVATGADKAFIGDYQGLDVEPSRKLPMVMTRDIVDGQISWRGKGVINPFGDDGTLVNLADYPKLRAYLEERKEQIAGRHVAAKNPRGWYRTIDRIYSDLTYREKLLIPDIKGDASVVYEEGKLYPHHNLYFIVTDEWDARALQAIMQSGIARLFVSLYSTRMRGDYLRFQAQYLRRIRIPYWRDVSERSKRSLALYSGTRDRHALNGIVSELYGLTPAELGLIEGSASA